MPRIRQKAATRGSQKWLQRCVALKNDPLTRDVGKALGVAPGAIQWLSPLKSDGYAEYRDDAFLEELGVTLDTRSLARFWPRRGPVWDGLGRNDRGDLLLVEAKSHIGEMLSSPSAATGASKTLIRKSLRETQAHLGVDTKIDWSQRGYQYCNRLAHLHLLRTLNRQRAWLVFVHFVNDKDMHGPATRAEWEAAITTMKGFLGLPKRHRLSRYVIDVFVDVKKVGRN